MLFQVVLCFFMLFYVCHVVWVVDKVSSVYVAFVFIFAFSSLFQVVEVRWVVQVVQPVYVVLRLFVIV